VVTGEVLVDLEHTSRTELATGIQRVARMSASRWSRDHDTVLVGWTSDHRALRRLQPAEAARALTGSTQGLETDDGSGRTTVVVPWGATYVLPELALERERTLRMLAMARFSRSRTAIIGHDCVPVSSAETTDVGVSEGFSNYLAAVRHMDRIATVSEASAGEFRGWRHMLSAIGVGGPAITAVSLPVEAREPDERSLAEVRDRLTLGSVPLVLCVGTHEPRKNHLAVLHAAEILWRRGVRFNLAFIGGHSWNSHRFDAGVARLRAAGRPIEMLTSVTDEALWAAYRVSHCLVFPSLNEGFGLPVAEALSCGTPVVTSKFGSMAEIAQDGGAVLVDPRDDASVVDGLERVLTDPAFYADLRAAAAARPSRSWDDYARETWDLLVDEGKS
jgi:glycosyltransferase involved in cell wall biosynthesis